jgi:RNA polymerase sigma-70 factor, ECF subfamily
MAHLTSPYHFVGVTLAFILAAPDLPDDVGAPERYARSPAARRAREDAVIVAARDRALAEHICSADTFAADHAFSQLMQAYADRLIRFAYGFVKSRDAAEDLVQDVFVRVWERRATIRPDESLRAYLFTSVRRAALDLLKRRMVEARYATGSMHDLPAWNRPTIEERLDAQAIARAVSGALARLPERRRTALHLRYEEQLPFAVVAEVMGLSEKSVKHLVTRAVEELRGYLGL